MSFCRDWLCVLLFGAALGCFVLGIWPQRSESIDPTSGDKISELRCGLWFSPSYVSIRRDHLARGGGFNWSAGPRWLSWSTLLILLGFVCFNVLRRRMATLRTSSTHDGGLGTGPGSRA